MMFIDLIPKALGSSTQIISGLLIDERDKPSLTRLIKISLKYSLTVTAIMTPIIFLTAPTIADLYVPDADATTYQMTLEGLRLYSLVMLPCAMSLVSNYYYVAAGKLHLATVTTVLNNIGVVPFAFNLDAAFRNDGALVGVPVAIRRARAFGSCRDVSPLQAYNFSA